MVPHPLLKLVITICLGLAGLIAMLGSLPPGPVVARVESVLLMMTSRTRVAAESPEVTAVPGTAVALLGTAVALLETAEAGAR